MYKYQRAYPLKTKQCDPGDSGGSDNGGGDGGGGGGDGGGAGDGCWR